MLEKDLENKYLACDDRVITIATKRLHRVRGTPLVYNQLQASA